MSQGSVNESKLRLEAVAATPLKRQDAGLKADSVLKVADGISGQNQISSSEQASAIAAKKVAQSFDTIRDPHKSMLQLMDALFDSLQILVYEANQANEDSKLQFHLLRPTLEKQAVTSTSWLKTTPEPPAFTGKIYSYDWSLMLKGTSEIILCYVIPSDRVISFNTEPEIYKPYLAIKFFRKGSNVCWQIDHKTIMPDVLPDLTKKLFDKLLRSVKNQQWNESTFCLESIGMATATGETNVIEPSQGQQPLDPDQLLKEMMQTARESTSTSDEFKIESKEKLATPVVDQSNKETISVSSAAPSQTVEVTLQSLIVLLEQRLERMVGEGAEALNNHDFTTAKKVLALTDQLHEFKKRADEVLAALKN